MAQVDLKQLTKETGLDPRVIRRLLRKAGQHAPYLWDDSNPAYKEALEACRESKKEKPKKAPSVKRERQAGKSVKWDPRGMCVIEGGAWGLALVPKSDDPTIQVAESVYLGPEDDVRDILEGKTSLPAHLSDKQQLAFKILMGGEVGCFQVLLTSEPVM